MDTSISEPKVQSQCVTNAQYTYLNIQAVLLTKLQKARQQSPERFSKPIHILNVVGDSAEDQLELQLRQDKKDHIGERIILIPYYIEKSHWIGICLEFQADGQIKRADYIDPVNGPNVIPERLQKRFSKVYSIDVLRTKDLLKHDDRERSEVLTIKNLLTAVESAQLPKFIFPEVLELHTKIKDHNQTSTLLSEQEQSNRLKTDESNLTSYAHVPTEGNRDKLHELEQELNIRLANLKIRDTTMLSEKTKKIEERIKEYEDEARIEDVEKEKKYLHEFQIL